MEDEEREQVIMRVYYDTLKQMQGAYHGVSVEDVVRQMMAKGAPRFFVSFETTRRFISQMCRGIPPAITNRNKLAMYQEIFRRYILMREQHGITGFTILKDIIRQPAPSYYMDSFNLRRIIYTGMRRKKRQLHRNF